MLVVYVVGWAFRSLEKKDVQTPPPWFLCSDLKIKEIRFKMAQ